MRKTSLYLLLVAAACMAMTACFKDEPLNAECDIERAWIHYDRPGECVWNLSDTIISNVYSADSIITFKVKAGTDRAHLAPQFAVTAGAALTPASGTERDFSRGPLTYTVTSEDGNWQRTYRVEFVEEHRTTRDTINYDFEHVSWSTGSLKYYIWSELREDGTEANIWASGNGGFAISNSSAAPDDYPTVSVDEGYEGKGVKLTTRKTGAIAAMVKMPMAAGNLFIGNFVTESALTNALRSTQFGQPFDKKPTKFTGYYKYAPGDTFQDRYGNVEEGRTDEGAIYAILFRNHDADGNPVVLYGDNVQTSEQIVAKAILPEMKPAAEWTRFELEFDYGGQELDQETLDTFGYSLTVVFSSSTGGAYFQGAIGSTLYVDKVEIICESTE